MIFEFGIYLEFACLPAGRVLGIWNLNSMEIIKINLKKPKTWDIELIVDHLQQGRVIAYPTDTIYGLGCDATNVAAVKRIFKIKKRPNSSPLLVLVKSYCMLHELCYVSPKQDRYIRSIWPSTTRDAQNPSYSYKKRPTTFILKSKGNLPKEVSGGQDTLAVRLPKNEFLIKILKKLNQPIISSSLNISGQRTLKDLSQIGRYFRDDQPDLVVESIKSGNSKSSAIVDITDINEVKFIRQ